jgi:hypothetical protein
MVQNDVPEKTQIRYLSRENGKLLAEIDRLNYIIEQKDLAIKEFKKWQSKVAQYKWEYWLTQGIELMETPPDESLRKALNGLLGANRIFDEWKRKVERAYNSYEKAKERLATKV